jgi:hypothetical protein
MSYVAPFLLLAVAASAAAGETPAPDPQPEDAVRGVVRAFGQYPVVAIAEMHWLRQAGDFCRALVKDPAFQGRVNDIVIEFGTPRHQTLLDRYVAGEEVPAAELCRVWRDTTKVFSWESPIYAELLAAVREANRGLPPGRRLRVVAGDTPVDWAEIKTHEDWVALGDNDVSFARVITGEVLDKRRKALVILGSNHLTRCGTRTGGPNTTTRVEKRYPGSTFVALMYAGQPAGLEKWLAAGRPPCLYPLKGARLGTEPTSWGKLANLADALLYLGPKKTLRAALPDTKSFEPEYLRELDRRSRIEWGRPFDLQSVLSRARSAVPGN